MEETNVYTWCSILWCNVHCVPYLHLQSVFIIETIWRRLNSVFDFNQFEAFSLKATCLKYIRLGMSLKKCFFVILLAWPIGLSFEGIVYRIINSGHIVLSDLLDQRSNFTSSM